MTSARVSIIVTVHNRTAFLAEAVGSALAQTHPHCEVIVADDGSAADIRPALGPYADRVRLLRRSNAGQGAARNLGFAHASGEYVLFLDDDDVLEPNAIEALLSAINDRPQAKWAAGGLTYIDELGHLRDRRLSRCLSGDVYPDLIDSNPIGPPCAVLISAEAFRQVGGFDESRSLQLAEDYDLWLALAREYPAAIVDRCVARYRLHPAQSTKVFRLKHGQARIAVLEKQRRSARPGFVPRFKTAIANAQLELGDDLYQELLCHLARRYWRKSFLRQRRTSRLRLAARIARSCLPKRVLSKCRELAKRLRPDRRPIAPECVIINPVGVMRSPSQQ